MELGHLLVDYFNNKPWRCCVVISYIDTETHPCLASYNIGKRKTRNEVSLHREGVGTPDVNVTLSSCCCCCFFSCLMRSSLQTSMATSGWRGRGRRWTNPFPRGAPRIPITHTHTPLPALAGAPNPPWSSGPGGLAPEMLAFIKKEWPHKGTTVGKVVICPNKT